MNRILILLIIGLISFSCRKTRDSDTINQDKIHCIYKVVYNSKDTQTELRVVFSVEKSDGRKIRLSEGSNISANGLIMNFDEIDRLYTLNLSGKIDTLIFEWKDLDSEIYVNQVILPELIDYPILSSPIFINPDDIYLDTLPFYLIWLGNSVQNSQESIRLLVNGGEKKPAFSRMPYEGYTLVQDSVSAEGITLTKPEDNRYEYYKIELIRMQKLSLQTSTEAGGHIETVYSAGFKNVIVK